MSEEKEYFENVARFRRMLERELDGEHELPDLLKPENQSVPEEIRLRSQELRDTVLRGDEQTLMESAARETAGAGFNRSEEEVSEIPALEEARRRRKEQSDKDHSGEGDQIEGDGDRTGSS